jgi:hypothetical protein
MRAKREVFTLEEEKEVDCNTNRNFALGRILKNLISGEERMFQLVLKMVNWNSCK